MTRTSQNHRFGSMLRVIVSACLLAPLPSLRGAVEPAAAWVPTRPSCAEEEPALTTASDTNHAWLNSKPFVWNEQLVLDTSSYVPIPGEEELAESAEPLEVNEQRVTLERLGPNRFRVDLKLEGKTFEPQRDDEWCWAACAWMVNEYNRRDDPSVVSLSQETLAHYFQGGEEHQAANLSTITRALCLDLEAQHRLNGITLGADFLNIGPNRMVRDLSAGSMPVVGLVQSGLGHAVVVTGVTYSVTAVGQAAIKTHELNARLDDAEQFSDFLGKVKKARKLTEEKKSKKKDGKKKDDKKKGDKKKGDKKKDDKKKGDKKKDGKKKGGKKKDGKKKDDKKKGDKKKDGKKKGDKKKGDKKKGDKKKGGKKKSSGPSEKLEDVGKVVDVMDGLADAYAIESISILDPWDPDQLELTLTGEQLREQLGFIMTREMAHELLTQGGDDTHWTFLGALGLESDVFEEAQALLRSDD